MGLKEFQLISKLGDGAFSSVWKVRRIADGQEYAMKKVKLANLSDKEKQNALNEVRILASVKHPNIIGYKEAFLEDDSMTLCIVMEHAGGGDLYHKILQHQKSKTYMKEDALWVYAIQMISGLKTLHDMKIYHRDLKSANIFLSADGRTVKVGDLNVSKVAKANLVYTQTGTPYYASPEVWRDQPYDHKSDIWSLGCVLYELCTLKPPFRASDMNGLYKKVQKGVFERIPANFSNDLNELISLCLKVNPTTRPDCDKLLNHPLVIKHCRDIIPKLEDSPKNDLLMTIKFPRNIKSLVTQLPKAAYNEGNSDVFDKITLKKPDEETERGTYKRKEQRALSQHYPSRAVEEKPQVRRISSGQHKLVAAPKLNPSQKENQESRREKVNYPVENKENQVSNNNRILQERNATEANEVANRRRRVVLTNENKDDLLNIKNIIQDIENLDQNIQSRKMRVQALDRKILNEKPIERAEYNSENLVEKYLGPEYNQEDRYGSQRPLQAMYSDRDERLFKRADNIVKKYQADAVMQEKRDSFTDLRRNIGASNNPYSKEAHDILERYNNAYNVRESDNDILHRRAPGYNYQNYQRPDYADCVKNNYNRKDYSSNIPANYYVGVNTNNIRYPPIGVRGVRPF